jgi:hypothetical protein
VASSVAATYLHCRQMRKLPRGTERNTRNAAANLIAAAVAVGPAWLIVHLGAGMASGPWERMRIAGAATLAAAVTYLVLQFVRGSKEMALLLPLPTNPWQGLRQRRGDGPATPPRMPADTPP